MSYCHFVSDVVNLLGVNHIYNKKIKNLSGGELQRLSITICLGTPADVYLLDEPSASLDVEYRFNTTKVIKRFFLHNNKLGFVIEHDILMAILLARESFSQVLVLNDTIDKFHKTSTVSGLMDYNTGINMFLKDINTTFRTDKINNRPKINKLDSVMDKEQKINNTYFI